MMKPGQEYLFFLSPKEYPEQSDAANMPQEYILQDNVYARIAIDPELPALDVAVLDPQTDYISFQESEDYPFIVDNAADADLYRQARDSILERISSLSS
jgi:hypothetical protein